jgi:hypothetical protein
MLALRSVPRGFACWEVEVTQGSESGMNREMDMPGSIRWDPDAFAELPAPRRRAAIKLEWGGIATLTLTAVAFLARSAGRSDRISPTLATQLEIRPDVAQPVEQPAHPKLRRRRGPIPAVSNFTIATVQEIGAQIRDEDFVIGVELDGAARAYAINMMGTPQTELLNDTLQGRPILTSFCNQCQCSAVFSRRVADRTLTFFLSGETIDDNMVMEDTDTGSKWLQLTGEAIAGPLKGHRLDQFAAIWTDWKTWRAAHPASTGPRLPRLVENYQHHTGYSQFLPERSFFSNLQWGLVLADKARSWPYAQLSEQSVVNDRFAGQPLLIVFDRKTSTPTAFQRRIAGLDLTFQLRADGLTDEQTHSLWDPITGKALSGPMVNQKLTAVPGTISLQRTWRKFFPSSAIWSGGDH